MRRKINLRGRFLVVVLRCLGANNAGGFPASSFFVDVLSCKHLVWFYAAFALIMLVVFPQVVFCGCFEL